jgi:hypothetical protein
LKVVPLNDEIWSRMQNDQEKAKQDFLIARQRARRKRAQIVGLGRGYTLAGRLGDFPHWKVSIPRREYFWLLPWPLIGTKFSHPGDSGSWVVAADCETSWLGLLVGAEGETLRNSVIIRGDLLVNYLAGLDSLNEGNRQFGVGLVPMLLSRSEAL